MGTTPRTYTAEFKCQALDLLASSGKTASAVAKDLGFNSSNLTRWRREAAEEGSGHKAFTGHGMPRDEELDKLRRENADLRVTNEILKKPWPSSPGRRISNDLPVHRHQPSVP